MFFCYFTIFFFYNRSGSLVISFSAKNPTTLTAPQQASLIANIGSKLDEVMLTVNGTNYTVSNPVAFVTKDDGNVLTGKAAMEE